MHSPAGSVTLKAPGRPFRGLSFRGPLMVLAVRCPNPQCRKYQLVEDADRGRAVSCLVCKQAIKVPAAPAPAPLPAPPGPTPPAPPLNLD